MALAPRNTADVDAFIRDTLKRPASAIRDTFGLPRGWEIQNAVGIGPVIHAPTGTPLWPAVALVTPAPGGRPPLAKTIIQPAYGAAFKRYMGFLTKSRDEDFALAQLDRTEQAALSEGTDSTGGVLADADFQAVFAGRLAQQSVFAQHARNVPCATDRYIEPRVLANTGSGLGSVYS
jgi:hypothetical protein